MVRTYKRTPDRGKYGSSDLGIALKQIQEGIPLIRVSKEHAIPARTFRRHRDKKVSSPGILQMGRYRTVFSVQFENELKDHIVDMQRRMFGLTTKDLRKLAFDVANKAELDHPFNKESGMAGHDWLSRFLERNNLSLRQPQATSIARIVGFNKPKVKQFFELLKSILHDHNYQATKIWNMDETGLTTVQKPSKIMAQKGTRQVGKVTSAERGELVTFFCAMNAAGGYLPPMCVFPRKRMVDAHTTTLCPDNLVLIKTRGDGRCLYRSLVIGMNFDLKTGHRNENGILTNPILAEDETRKADEMRENLVGYMKENLNEFKTLGDDYVNVDLPSRIRYTSLEHRINDMANKNTMPGEIEILALSQFLKRPITILSVENRVISRYGENTDKEALLEQFESVGEDVGHYNCLCASSHPNRCAVEGPSGIRNLIQALSPLPKISKKRTRSRKTESATILTSSPYKNALLEKQNKPKKRNPRKRQTRKVLDQQRKKPRMSRADEGDDDEWPCLMCGEDFSTSRPGESWVQCQVCLKWAHDVCTAGTRQFVCPNCESDIEID